jgi:hypothetical protein
MLEDEGAQRQQCQYDIAYLAEQFISYPLIKRLSLNDGDREVLRTIQTGREVVHLQKSAGESQPMWRLVALYLLHQLLFGKTTTFFLIAQTKHLARKSLETLYFPLNHLGLSFLPEIEVKYTGCLKLSNDVCIRAIGIEDDLPEWETKEAVVISYGLSEIPIPLRGKKWIQVPDNSST